jgi:vanillate O-demethylase ferredoxin subunit
MEAYWQKLQSLVPDPAEALIHFPAKPRDPVEIFAIERGAPHANARTMLFLDAYSGEVLRFRPYAQSSLGHKAYFWTLSWHTGMLGGIGGPLILISGALALIFLGLVGHEQLRSPRPVAGALKTSEIQVASGAKFTAAESWRRPRP